MKHQFSFTPDVLPWQEITPAEYWESKKAREGDHIRVSRGMYNHHGIYVSDKEVIHFSSHDDDNVLGEGNEVIQTSLSQFLRDGKLEVKIYSADEERDLYPVHDIVRWARSCLGDDGYHLIFNNCEHFANYCTLGRFHSQQVDNVLGGAKMGLFSAVGGFVSRLFGGGSSGGSSSRESSSTVYEPDKVKVAEIERDKELKLAHAANDRIVLMKEAQMELAEFNAKMEAAVIEARARGFHALTQSLLGMLKEVNILGEERLVLIENASLQEVRKAEELYADLEKDIANDDFMTHKIHQLYDLLAKYPEGSTAHKSFAEGIQMQMKSRIEFVTDQLSQIKHRRQTVIESVLASKQLIHTHINDVVAKRIQQMEQVMLEYKPPVMQSLPANASVAALGTGKAAEPPQIRQQPKK